MSSNSEPTVFERLNRAFTGLNEDIDKPVRSHLRNVYATVGLGIFSSAIGAAIHWATETNIGLLLSLVSIYLIYRVYTSGPRVDSTRMGMFLAFCALNGIGLGPLLQRAIRIDPSIVMTSLLGASAIFFCFTMAALTSKSTKYLHLRGTLSSALFGLLFGCFFLSHFVIICASLLITCGFLLYDTQRIVEKNKMGDNDYLKHALDLFIDFARLYKDLLLLLSEKREGERRNKRRD